MLKWHKNVATGLSRCYGYSEMPVMIPVSIKTGSELWHVLNSYRMSYVKRLSELHKQQSKMGSTGYPESVRT